MAKGIELQVMRRSMSGNAPLHEDGGEVFDSIAAPDMFGSVFSEPVNIQARRTYLRAFFYGLRKYMPADEYGALLAGLGAGAGEHRFRHSTAARLQAHARQFARVKLACPWEGAAEFERQFFAALRRRMAVCERHKTYYAEHRNERLIKDAAYRAAHRKELNARAARYRAERHEEIRARARAYHAAHREEISARQRERYVQDRAARQEQLRVYRAEHREEIRAKKKAYWTAHREELIAKKREYHAANRERDNAKCREYDAAHREEKRARNKAYREAHREELCAKKREWYLRKKAAAAAQG